MYNFGLWNWIGWVEMMIILFINLILIKLFKFFFKFIYKIKWYIFDFNINWVNVWEVFRKVFEINVNCYLLLLLLLGICGI